MNKYGKVYAMRQPTETALAHAVTVFENAGGVMRTSEILAAGVEARTLYWMRDNDLVEMFSRGVYHLASMPVPAYPDIATVFRRYPHGVLCLVSALSFHDIGTQIPSAVQIAVPSGTKTPRIAFPSIQKFTMSPTALEAGVEEHDVDGTAVRVFSVPKTVADCFKYRNRIGFDVALEALQDAIRYRHTSPAEVMEFARVDRVQNIVRPYLEALT